MRVLVDTNVLLDLLLEREAFVEEATTLMEMIELGQVVGYLSATTITNIFYIVRKSRGENAAKQAVSRILAGLQICPVDRSILEQAVSLNFKDFEDAVQVACAIFQGLEAIVTRDAQGFTRASLPILSVNELCDRLR